MTNTNTNSVFADALITGLSVFNKKAARIDGGKVGVANYEKWHEAMQVAHGAFYDYKHAVDQQAKGKKVDVEAKKNEGMKALQAILDLVGTVNGFTVKKNEDIFADLSVTAVKAKTDLKGRALLIDSKLKIVRKELRNINGAEPTWVESKEAEKDSLSAELSRLKKLTESGDSYNTQASYDNFSADFERALAKIVNKQNMKSREELEAERKAEKDKKREENKAKRQAKRQAEAKAKAETESK